MTTSNVTLRVVGWVSGSCAGEWCQCGRPASHKVSEVIQSDDPVQNRHELTAYKCCLCFRTTFMTHDCGHRLVVMKVLT